MPGLRELQARFAAAVLNEADPASGTEFVKDGRFPGPRRLQVYRNNIYASLTSALTAVYPVVTRLVGTGFFGYMADSYLRQYPARSGNLHDVGHALADFLPHFPAAASLPYLADVARLEWAWHRAFHGAEHAPLDLQSLATVAPARHADLRFTFHPTARLVASEYPILRIWQVNQAENMSDDIVDLASGGEQGLVLRSDMTVEILPLSWGEYILLQQLNMGASFGTACDKALNHDPSLDLSQLLQKHIQYASLVAYEVDEG